MNIIAPKIRYYLPLVALLLFFGVINCIGQRKEVPAKPSQERLVNDFANVMTAAEAEQLEQKLQNFAVNTSNQITIVTVDDLGDYEIADFATDLGKKWGVGKTGKDNGIVVLAAIHNRKINISTGKGLEGALPDLLCNRIIQNEIAPAFKQNQYFEGFSKGADAIIAATRNEYKGDGERTRGKKNIPAGALIIVIIFIVFILRMRNRGGGNNGGGIGNFATGMLLGNMMGGGFGGRDSGNSGGGFGGFGGGDFGGGGASGSW